MIDKQKILNDLTEYFTYDGKITIDDRTGKVSVIYRYCSEGGDVYLKEDIKHAKLPVQFAVVDGDFDCCNNHLKTLVGAPKSVGGGFYCNDNLLETLAGAPQWVGGSFNCSDNSLKTLVGAPNSVGGGFNCSYNSLETLTGAPRSVGGYFWCDYNPKLGLLRIILSNCNEIYLYRAPDAVTQIIKKYLGKGQSGALQCAAELIRAGYKENAKL
jgi:hypothetical protein